MNWPRAWATRAAVLLAAGLLLSGCFDLNIGLNLKSDGSGTLTNEVIFSKEMTDTFKQTGGKLPQPKASNGGKQTSAMRGGRLVQTNLITFSAVSGITMSGQGLEVRDLGRTWFGAHRSAIVLGSSGKPAPKPSTSDKDNPFYKAMMAQFDGHFVSVTMAVPCNVSHADPIKMGKRSIAPTVESSWTSGATVRWKVPLHDMLSDDGTNDVRFALECWSWNGIAPGKSKQVAGPPPAAKP
ncbi:MAG: hypothetical protein JSR60_12580 [Proteobacteria bacterium]|nr:hypothetical protein [Pseudomonadota bacterium]